MLKVPEFVPRTATSSAPAPAPVIPAPQPEPEPVAPVPAPEPAPLPPVIDQTRAMPVVEQNRSRREPSATAPAPAPEAVRGSLPVAWWIRLLLWIAAVPLSFFVVFSIARGLGWFTTTQLSDVFLANNASRFWPVVRLLPLVALMTALLVHGGVLFISKRRVR